MLTSWHNDDDHLYQNALLKREPQDRVSGDSLTDGMGTPVVLDCSVGF